MDSDICHQQRATITVTNELKYISKIYTKTYVFQFCENFPVVTKKSTVGNSHTQAEPNTLEPIEHTRYTYVTIANHSFPQTLCRCCDKIRTWGLFEFRFFPIHLPSKLFQHSKSFPRFNSRCHSPFSMDFGKLSCGIDASLLLLPFGITTTVNNRFFLSFGPAYYVRVRGREYICIYAQCLSFNRLQLFSIYSDRIYLTLFMLCVMIFIHKWQH